MKFISFLLILFSFPACYCLAGEKESITITSYHKVISDKADNTVGEGRCKVFGFVHSINVPMNKVKVGLSDHSLVTKTDSTGYYELILSESDSSIYAFKSGFDEDVVESHDFKSKHSVQIDFYLAKNRQNMQMKKPVIYLYADKDTECQLSITPHNSMSFTYPETKDSWIVKIHKDGSLIAKNKEVPYLFWEGNQDLQLNSENDKIIGNVVSKGDVVTFFEDELTNFGLSRTEVTDFITFWAPQMTTAEKYLIQFKTNEEYENEIARLSCDCIFDAELRIFALIQPLKSDEKVGVTKQHLKKNERIGLTLVEWGGAISNDQKTF